MRACEGDGRRGTCVGSCYRLVLEGLLESLSSRLEGCALSKGVARLWRLEQSGKGAHEKGRKEEEGMEGGP